MAPEGIARRRWHLTRRRVIVGIVVLLAVAVRVALPSILRAQLEQRGTDMLLGTVTVGDVDLSLARGGIAIEHLAFRAEGDKSAPPLLAFRRLWVNLSWLGLLRRTVRLEELSLDGLKVTLERSAAGAVALPAPRPAAGAAPSPPPEQPATSSPWRVAIGYANLHGGVVRLRDHVTDPPIVRELALPSLEAHELNLQPDPEKGPAHGQLQVRIGDGVLVLKTRVAATPAGFALTARLKLADVPIDRAQMHIPRLGWSSLSGRLEGQLSLRADPGKLPRAAGHLALRNLRVEVAAEEKPALAWRSLEVAIERLDPNARVARIARVALDGGAVLVRPRANPPLPVIPASKTPAGSGDEAAQPAPPPTAEPAPPSAAAAWSWRLASLEVTDTSTEVRFEAEPLEVVIARLAVKGVASEPGSTMDVSAEVHEGDGTLTTNGTVRLDPLGLRLDTTLAGIAPGRLLDAVGGVPLKLASATLGGTVHLDAVDRPLTVSGDLALADLRIDPAPDRPYDVKWSRLGVSIREVVVPGALPGDTSPISAPIQIGLAEVRLEAPEASFTRTAQAAATPADAAGAGGTGEERAVEPEPTAAAPAAAPAATPAAAPAARPLELAVAHVVVERGSVTLTDETVKPPYRGRVAAIQLDARGLAYPANTIDNLTLSLRTPGGAPFRLQSRRRGGSVDVEATLKELPLPQFTPYAAPASGFSIAKGEVSLDSKVRLSGSDYRSENRLVVADLALAGTQGESLFLQQFGIPLSLALSLLKDTAGRISLGVPITGDRTGGPRVTLAPLVAQALQRALVGALASPLKLLGAVSLTGGKVASFAPAPIPFRPGLAEPSAEGEAAAEQLGRALEQLPAIGVALAGNAGPADVQAMKEAQVLADLQGSGAVVGAFRNLTTGGAHGAIREVLERRAKGETADVPEEHRATFEEWLGRKSVADTALHDLAAARATRAREMLVSERGIASERVQVVEPIVDPSAGVAQVTTTLEGASTPP